MMEKDEERWRFASLLSFLILLALILSLRIGYLFLADTERFPINTIKIASSGQHISRKQIEAVLNDYLDASFFSLSVSRLQKDLSAFDWAEDAKIERIWPDTLKITLLEKQPVAHWNNALLTKDAKLFTVSTDQVDPSLPRLSGPENQEKEVLQIYQKLSKLLASYGLRASSLCQRDNQAFELSLDNGIVIRLGKEELEQRLIRFCKAYSMIFADKSERLASVDLRYARGMAVKWKPQTEK